MENFKKESDLKDALKWIINILNTKSIQYQIAGGFGAYLYGSHRNINDIDIDIRSEGFTSILPDIKNYIVFGPARYKDEKWDIDLITLNYHGQLIDISGTNEAKIYDEKNKKWIPYPDNFEMAQKIKTFDIEIKMIDPNDLINYKKLLNGEHQKIDITAIEHYLSTK